MSSKTHKAGTEKLISKNLMFSLECMEKMGHTTTQEKEHHKIVSFLP